MEKAEIRCPNVNCNSTDLRKLGEEEAVYSRWKILACNKCEEEWTEVVMEHVDLKNDATRLSFEVFEVVHNCLMILGIYPGSGEREGNGKSQENKCLDELKRLKELLSKVESETSREWMREICKCREEFAWAVKEVDFLKREASFFTVKRKASEIIHHLKTLEGDTMPH